MWRWNLRQAEMPGANCSAASNYYKDSNQNTSLLLIIVFTFCQNLFVDISPPFCGSSLSSSYDNLLHWGRHTSLEWAQGSPTSASEPVGGQNGMESRLLTPRFPPLSPSVPHSPAFFLTPPPIVSPCLSTFPRCPPSFPTSSLKHDTYIQGQVHVYSVQ